MSLVSSVVPNLINGVSQQADELRYPSQLTEQINYTSDPVKGLKKRNPVIWAGNMDLPGAIGDDDADRFYHDIQRDGTEKYTVEVKHVAGSSPTDVQIFVRDLNGDLKDVNTDGGSGNDINDAGNISYRSYLATTTPKSDLKAVTVADYTFLLNKTVTPALTSDVSSSRNPEAIVMVKQSRFNTTYTVKIWNTASSTGAADHTATFTTLSSLVAQIDTPSAGDSTTVQLESQGDIMDNLVSGLSSPSGYTLTQSGALLHIQRDTATDFRIEVTCDAPEHLFVFKDKVQDISLLPKEGYNGFEIQIEGSPEEEGDEYYVKFENPEGTAVGFTNGSWVETIAQGVNTTIDQDTMPMALISESDGSFTLKPIDWTDRLVGDDDSNPSPSFIGNPIKEIYFYKNRLSFLADENRIMSQHGEFFNFWRTTITFLKDEDVIDNSNPHTKVSLLNHAVPIGGKDNEFVTLWSDKTIFQDSANGLWTPSTTSIAATEEVEVSTLARPIAVNKKIYFTYSTGTYSGVSEYKLDPESQEWTTEQITQQIPNYILGEGYHLLGSSRLNTLALVPETEGSIYIYRFFERQGQKLQSAWYKYAIGDHDAFTGFQIRYAFFVDTKLYLIYKHGGNTSIGYIDLDISFTDPNSNITTYLDSIIDDTDLTAESYDVINNETEFTLPYDIPDNSVIGIGTRRTSLLETTAHIEIPVKRYDRANKKVYVKGDWTNFNLWLGFKYLPQATLTRPTIRNKADGTNLPVAGGKFYVRRGVILYDNTRHFEVTVDVNYRDSDTIPFKAQSINVGVGGVSQSPEPQDGAFPFPVLADSREVEITLSSPGLFGSNFISLEWEGKYHRYSRFI